MLTHQLRRIAQFLLIPLLFSVTGCQNHNLFSKLHGDSSNPATLTSEASIALRNKDYSKALELSNKALDQDPNNSDALYDAAAAKLGLAGFDLGTLVSNVLSQVGSSSVSSLSTASGLGDLVRSGRDGVTAQNACGGASSLIAGLDCTAISNVLGSVIADLLKIIRGDAHGTIQRTDVALAFDAGLLYALQAAFTAAINGYMDVTNVGGTYGVAAGPNLSTLCSNHPNDALAIVSDLAASYSSFNYIVVKSNVTNNSIVRQVRDDINVVGQKLLTEGAGQILPNECFDNGGVFQTHNPPITKDTYLTAFPNPY